MSLSLRKGVCAGHKLTQVCAEYNKNGKKLPPGLWEDIQKSLHWVS
jgi:hypothetical protein